MNKWMKKANMSEMLTDNGFQNKIFKWENYAMNALYEYVLDGLFSFERITYGLC